MFRSFTLRSYRVTVLVVAVLSITVGMVVAGVTGQYVGVFFAQLLVAGLLAAWYTRIPKRSDSRE